MNVPILNLLMLLLNVIICLYVDDMLILSPNLGMINEIKKMLASNFDIKNMRAYVILGIKITITSDGLIRDDKNA